MHLFGFTVEIYHDARSHERQIDILTSSEDIILQPPASLQSLFTTASQFTITIYNLTQFFVLYYIKVNLWDPTERRHLHCIFPYFKNIVLMARLWSSTAETCGCL